MKITIIRQDFYYKHEDEKKVIALLDAFGIEYYKEWKTSDTKLGDLDFSVRASGVLYSKFAGKHMDYREATITDLVNMFSRSSLVKARGCGRRTIKEIEEVLTSFGYKLKD